MVASAGEAIEVKSNPTTQVIVRKDSGIKSAADLKGKAIAAPTLGAVIHVATLYWLKKNGVDPASIRGVEVPFPNMGDQLKAGNVDAVEALEPFAGALLGCRQRLARRSSARRRRRGAVPVLDFRRQMGARQPPHHQGVDRRAHRGGNAT